MRDTDTSPAALRALADKLREWDRCYPGNCNVDMLASYAEDALSALAAEKEAATVKPDLTVGATDRPERLWLSAPDADGDHGVWFEAGEGGTEYVRADLRASLAVGAPHHDPSLPPGEYIVTVDTVGGAATVNASSDAATIETLRVSLAAAEYERHALRLAMVRVCNATDGYAAESVSTEFLLRVPAEVEACIGQLRAERIAATQLRLDLENAHAHCDVFVAERKDLIARAEKAEAERDAARWQPIETAPKDGTLVDLWAGERIADCAWNVPSNCWAERSVSSFSGRPYWAVVNNPTHWMPLPAAPTNPEDAPHA